MSDLMTTKEIAEFCGLSEWTIRKEINAKRLKARETGDGWKTLRHIVEDFRGEFYGRGDMTNREIMKACGLDRNWEYLHKTHDELIARHKPTGKVWGFRY